MSPKSIVTSIDSSVARFLFRGVKSCGFIGDFSGLRIVFGGNLQTLEFFENSFFIPLSLWLCSTSWLGGFFEAGESHGWSRARPCEPCALLGEEIAGCLIDPKYHGSQCPRLFQELKNLLFIMCDARVGVRKVIAFTVLGGVHEISYLCLQSRAATTYTFSMSCTLSISYTFSISCTLSISQAIWILQAISSIERILSVVPGTVKEILYLSLQFQLPPQIHYHYLKLYQQLKRYHLLFRK